MNPADYEYLSNFLLGTSGLSLGPGKEYLMESRLIPLAQSLDLDDIGQLVEALKSGSDPRIESAVTEAMTTNETSFFRDKKPFEELRETILPELINLKQDSKSLRIWCAAASTGQEPYTIKMVLKEHFPELDNWNIELVATDIDTGVLKRAQEGIYSQFEVQRGLPVKMLMKYFEQSEKGWKIVDDLKDRITWKSLNLLNDFSNLGVFDIVFCRNVLIYFQNETKKDILERICQRMYGHGYLFMGAAETVLGISDAFTRFKECRAAVYRPMSSHAVLASS
ncbi:MAG: protein-glutamate O-methyltransferase CheR [Planctomycetaceae bacterium]